MAYSIRGCVIIYLEFTRAWASHSFDVSAKAFNFSGMFALIFALITTFLSAFLAVRLAKKQPRVKQISVLICFTLSRLSLILGLIPHSVSMFTTNYAHHFGERIWRAVWSCAAY